jgi:hypothetical protein
VVRLIFGSPLGLPSAADVQLLLGELGIGASGVRPAARQVWGVAKYEASQTGRTDRADRLGIAVYGRDAADARLFTKAGRFVLYRDSGPSLTITRLQQVGHTPRPAQMNPPPARAPRCTDIVSGTERYVEFPTEATAGLPQAISPTERLDNRPALVTAYSPLQPALAVR